MWNYRAAIAAITGFFFSAALFGSESASGTIPDDALKKIEPIMKSYIDGKRAPGFVVLISQNGKLVYRNVAGWRDIEAKKPMTMDTQFILASMTKPITTVAALQLIEQGKLKLDTPVGQCVPQLGKMQVYKTDAEGKVYYANPDRPATIHDLLTHTAGLKYGVGHFQKDPVGRMYHDAELVASPFDEDQPSSKSLEDLANRLSRLPLANDPGKVWEYSVATDVLSHCVENISGERFDHYLESHIFKPLQMTDTRFSVVPGQQDRLAMFYTTAQDGTPHLIPNTFRKKYLTEPTLLSGGGGLISTATDYMKFAQMLANGGVLNGQRILQEDTVTLMRTNKLPPEILNKEPIAKLAPSFKGYGFGYGVAVLMHPEELQYAAEEGEYFWPGASGSKFWIDPKNHIVGVILTHVLGDITIDNDIKDAIYQSMKSSQKLSARNH